MAPGHSKPAFSSGHLGRLARAIEERRFYAPAAACLIVLLSGAFAPIATGETWNVGFQQTRVADPAAGRDFAVAFWYPTDQPEERVVLGPAVLSVSPDAEPAESIAGLVVIDRAGHFVFMAPCPAALTAELPALCRDPKGVDRAAVHDRINAEILAYFARVWQ